MNFRQRNIAIRIPAITFKRYGEVDWDRVAGVAFGTLAFVVVAAFALAFTFDGVRHIVAPPPKVITKTVYESALTNAQQDYIHQCDASQNNDDDHGIPNVEVTPWTCVYADPSR